MTRPMWPVVVESTTGHSLHTSIIQNIASVAYQALTTPWGWQPYAKTCRGRKKNWNVLIKIHYFLEHLLVFLQTVLQDAQFNHQDGTDSVLKHWHSNYRCRRITQKKAYGISNTAKVWNKKIMNVAKKEKSISVTTVPRILSYFRAECCIDRLQTKTQIVVIFVVFFSQQLLHESLKTNNPEPFF
jgi:hypothetical protein